MRPGTITGREKRTTPVIMKKLWPNVAALLFDSFSAFLSGISVADRNNG